MKRTIDMKYQQFLTIIVAVIGIMYMNPFWMWPTYKFNTFFLYLSLFMLIIAILFEGLFFFRGKIYKFTVPIILLLLYVYFVGEESQLGSIGVLLQYIFIAFISNLDYVNKYEIFEAYKKILAILLIPSLIVFCITVLRIGIPHIDIISHNAVDSQRAYLHYPFTVVYSNIYTHAPAMRLCGFLDEPGKLGTLIALILCADDFRLKDIYSKILLVSGLLSFSTAFYIIVFVFMIARYSKLIFRANKKIVAMSIILVCIIGSIIIFKNQYIQALYNVLFGKFKLNDVRGGQAIWENTKASFGNNWIKYLFGNGYYSCKVISEASWTTLIYDIGFVGIALHLFAYVFYTLKSSVRCKKTFVFLFVFVLSILQRQYVIEIPYFIIFFVGVLDIREIDTNNSEGRIEIV